MVKSMGTFKDTFKAEMEAQKEERRKEKEARKKANEAKGPLIDRIAMHAKNFGIGGVYSVIYLVVVYCIVMFGTLYLPALLNVIIGYFNASTALVIAVDDACLFFTAWMFVISFVIVRSITRMYIRSIKKLFKGDSTEDAGK